MSYLFDPEPLGDHHDNLSADLTSDIENIVNQSSLSGTNTLQPILVASPDSIISPKHIQTPDFSQSNICLSGSNLQPNSLDGAASRNSSVQYFTGPMGGPTSTFPLHQQNPVHSYSDLSFLNSNELIPHNPNLCTPTNPFAYPDYQYLGNQTVLCESHNTDVRGKYIPNPNILNRHYQEITHQYIRNQSTDVMRFGNNFHSSLDNNVFNNDAMLHRFHQDIKPLVPTHGFTKQNELQNAMSTLTYHNRADNLSIIGRKHKASEEGREEEWKRRKSLHPCRLCNMSFSTGNALGGHMSYHAKQKKLERQQHHFSSLP